MTTRAPALLTIFFLQIFTLKAKSEACIVTIVGIKKCAWFMVVFLVLTRFSSGRWWIFFNNKKYYGFKLFWNITKLRILWLKSFKICPLFVTWTARCASLIRHSLGHRLRLTSSTKSPKPKIFRVLINITIFYGRIFSPTTTKCWGKGVTENLIICLLFLLCAGRISTGKRFVLSG